MISDIDFITLSTNRNANAKCSGCKTKVEEGKIFYKISEVLCSQCFLVKYKCTKCTPPAIISPAIILVKNEAKDKLCNACAWKHYLNHFYDDYDSIISFYEYGNKDKIAQLRKFLSLSNINEKSKYLFTEMNKFTESAQPNHYYQGSLYYIEELEKELYINEKHANVQSKAKLFLLLILGKIKEALVYFNKILLQTENSETAILCLNYISVELLLENGVFEKISDFYDAIQDSSISKKRLKLFTQIMKGQQHTNIINLFKTEYSNSQLNFSDFFFIRQDLVKYLLHFKVNTEIAAKIIASHYDYVKNFIPETFQAFNYTYLAAEYFAKLSQHKLVVFFCEVTIETSLKLYDDQFDHLYNILILLATSKIELNDNIGVAQILTTAYEEAAKFEGPKKTSELIKIFDLFHQFFLQTNDSKAQRAQILSLELKNTLQNP